MNNYPIIALPGSDTWIDGYNWGNQLDQAFPGADAHNFASACVHNEYGPALDHAIVDLILVQQGERDDKGWIWHVHTADGNRWEAKGWCDYTGWDCQSGLEWQVLITEEDLDRTAQSLTKLAKELSNAKSQTAPDQL